MVEYIVLQQAKPLKKGSVIIKVKSIGELKAGTSDKGDWTKKDAIVSDNSGEQKLTLWNEDIQKFKEGECYKLETPFWSDYEGTPQLTLGKFCKIHEADETDLLPFDGQKPAESTSQSEPKKEGFETFEEHMIQFAEKALEAYIKKCISNGMEAKDIATGTSAVFNTALMQKGKGR